MLKRIRAAMSWLIVATLIGVTPGLECYRAVALTVQSAPVGRISGPRMAKGFSLPRGLSATGGSLRLPFSGFESLTVSPSLKGDVAVNPTAQGAALAVEPSRGLGVASFIAMDGAAVAAPSWTKGVSESIFSRLAQAVPDFSKTGLAESSLAHDDFMSRIGAFKSRQDDGSFLAATAETRGFSLAKGSKKRAAKAHTPESETSLEVDATHQGDKTVNPHFDENADHSHLSAGGPDAAPTSEFGGGAGQSNLFALSIAGAVALFHFSSPLLAVAVVAPITLFLLLAHEIGHAWMANRLGDSTAKDEGRMSFNPKNWSKHFSWKRTILPLVASIALIGLPVTAAVPVNVKFKGNDAVGKTALTAFAGPAVNITLALLGAALYAGLAATGLGGAMAGGLLAGSLLAQAVAIFTFLNVTLALGNLLPVSVLDGSHILRWFLGKIGLDGLAYRIDARTQKLNQTRGGQVRMAIVVIALSVLMFFPIAWVTGWLLSAGTAVAGVQLAAACLPFVAALGLMTATTSAEKAPEEKNPVPTTAAATAAPVTLIVKLEGAKTPISRFLHLDLIEPTRTAEFDGAQQAMFRELEAAGLKAETLKAHQAWPVAIYDRINAATLRVDASKAAQLRALLEQQGYKVWDNSKRRIVDPIVIKPENMDPSLRGGVTLDENLKITKAVSVQAIGKTRWGEPDLGFIARLAAKLTKLAIPQPAIGVIDTGADLKHPLLKRVKAMVNATSGPNVDDNGHGSWVSSMILNFAPWLKNLTHYKTFEGGGATLDDILKALTLAGNDGNLVISNSWGSDDGDPTGPDSQLVLKLAQEGHIMVFAAGNSGSGADTIGSPAIVQYKDDKTGAIRVMAVAAADRAKKIAYFSSRGPGSQKTKSYPEWPHRPDLTAIGYNVEGAWPTDVGGADRTDPVLGPMRAISGTSMSTPGVAGALALLLMMFGVTEKGEKADAVVNAVMGTLEDIKQDRDAQGEGFLDVEAAYKKLSETMTPVRPNRAARFFFRLSARAAERGARLRAWRAVPAAARERYRTYQIAAKHYGSGKNYDVALRKLAELEEQYPILAEGLSLLDRICCVFGGGR